MDRRKDGTEEEREEMVKRRREKLEYGRTKEKLKGGLHITGG